MCWQKRDFFLSIILLFVAGNTGAKLAGGHEGSSGTKLELIHRHDLLRNPRNGVHPVPTFQRMKQMFHHDTIRYRALSSRPRMKHGGRISSARRQVQENTGYYQACTNGSGIRAGEMPMYSGADDGTGQYFVHLKVGTPPQKVTLIADTGSELTWTKCNYMCEGAQCGRNLRDRRVFRADDSSTFKTVPCSSSMCKIELANLFSLAQCPSPMDPCAYDYRYLDGSSTVGVFANETVTFSLTNGKKTRLENVLVGCSGSSRGQSFQAADGIIGLGYSNHSFAVKAAKEFGGKFSYCLVDHLSPKNVSSYLIFGSYHETDISPTELQYTELVLGVISPFYAVNMKGISIGGILLGIPNEVWNVNGVGGVIVDSGSSLTFLTQPAYQPVVDALKPSLSSFRTSNQDFAPLEYCFNSTGFDESLVPRLVFHFTDGARFEPPVKSYVIDAATGVKCLGFVNATWPGTSVLGNIMQQNHFWEFDIAKARLGFASSSCSS
ncbi:aspartic protein nepenthesin-2 [Dorcoceras hygrometricum]|uniref:Aspartic protein nepenthesin-2 n=1 Tax=Dorcoceras hygrometricum TaxID=472368 RepID=A0A2Z7BEX4_9LAMI|nr:aspartic protein nepenthesin-2 [Dorcoceras hygrometricum]